MDAEIWADIQDMASKLEEMRQTSPENFHYMKGCIHGLRAKNELSGESNPALMAGCERLRETGVRV